jgi:short-subunit dehydrogenase
MLARRKEFLDQLQAELRSSGYTAIGYPCDLGNSDSIKSACEKIKENMPPAKVLVINVGASFNPGPFLQMDSSSLVTAFQTQNLGSFHLCQQIIPELLNNDGGSILFTGATASLRGGANFSVIAMTKFGTRALAQSLAREFGPKNIHVSHVIIDGVIESERGRQWLKTTEKDALLQPDSIAKEYVKLVHQDKSTWTHELDLRPFCEKFS